LEAESGTFGKRKFNRYIYTAFLYVYASGFRAFFKIKKDKIGTKNDKTEKNSVFAYLSQ